METLIVKIIREIKISYNIIERYTNYVYKIEHKNQIGSYYILRILLTSDLEWSKLDSFDNMNDGLIERVIMNYRLCDKLNIGPKIYKTFDIFDTKIIIYQYLEHKITQEYLDLYGDIIKQFIQSIHSKGIYHGDLHSNNIRMDTEGKLKIIDLETLFYNDEIDINNNVMYNPLIGEWINNSFEIYDIKEFITHELNNNWRYIIDD